MKRKGKVYIGTSGWHYKHWIGTFYPEGTKDKEQLKHYLEQFDTVELNNSFYRLPSISTFEQWKTSTPKGFQFVVKASRFITHMKKLKDPEQSTSEFFRHINALDEKLGPVLFQLPPFWKLNTERFAIFLEALPKGYRYVFEFRNTSWYEEAVYTLLRKYNAAFCMYELAGHSSPEIITADFIYVRLHGPGDKYQGSYSKAALAAWARKIKAWQNKGNDVYIYFDNDQAGYAAFNAVELKQMLEQK